MTWSLHSFLSYSLFISQYSCEVDNPSISLVQMKRLMLREFKWFAPKSQKALFLFIYFNPHHNLDVFKTEFIIFPRSAPSDKNSGEKPRRELWESSNMFPKCNSGLHSKDFQISPIIYFNPNI